MSAILFATAFSGVVVSKILLTFGVANLVVRYPLTVLFSYLVFFLCIKLWLLYISSTREKNLSHLADCLDFPNSSSAGSSVAKAPSLRGGGGNFSGGGSSASFDVHSSVATEVHTTALHEGMASVADHVGSAVGDTSCALGDLGEIFAVVALVALIVTIIGSAIYVITDAPAILSDAAFEGLLAAALVRKTQTISNEGWIGNIFRTTWKPFAMTLAVALFVAVVLHSYFPNAARLADVLK